MWRAHGGVEQAVSLRERALPGGDALPVPCQRGIASEIKERLFALLDWLDWRGISCTQWLEEGTKEVQNARAQQPQICEPTEQQAASKLFNNHRTKKRREES